MDALEITLFDLDGDRVHETGVYFTVDKMGPSFAGLPSDVFFTPPGAAGPVTFATAARLGLTNRDNLDAIAVWDVDFDGQADPGQDFILFSLDRGSPSLAGRSAADLFVSDFNGFFCLYLPAREIGMQRWDNVDAVDVEREIQIHEEPPFEVEPGEPVDPTEPQPVD